MLKVGSASLSFLLRALMEVRGLIGEVTIEVLTRSAPGCRPSGLWVVRKTTGRIWEENLIFFSTVGVMVPGGGGVECGPN